MFVFLHFFHFYSVFSYADVSVQKLGCERRLQQKERASDWCWWPFTEVKKNSFFNRSVWSWLVPILCCIPDLHKPVLRCSIAGWKGYWSTLSPRQKYSNMVYHQRLEFPSLKSWGCIWKLSERILCKCHCWRRENQVLCERKPILSYTRQLGQYYTHQQANIIYPTSIWWTESEWGGSSGSFRS